METNLLPTTWAEINLDNIEFNLNNIKKLLKEDTKVCCVLKANAYGHGALPLAKFLEDKVDYLAVARLEEALELKEINLDILVLGYIPYESLEIAIKNDITMTVYSLEMARIIDTISKKLNKKSKIHIKIDTGMNRLGFRFFGDCCDDIKVVFDELISFENLDIEGIFTHFATADEVDKTFSNLQIQRFKQVIDYLSSINFDIRIKHISNSAGIIDFKDIDFDMVRLGIALYGYYPSCEVLKNNVDLKPAMTVKTRISNIKYIDKNEGVSYGLIHKANEKELIATLPIGYADGFSRMQKNPKVVIKGHTFDVVGRVCMDQCMVNIDKDIDINIGDEVIIFGNGIISADDVSLDTICYEVLCNVSRRVSRVYIRSNNILQIDNYLIK